MPKLTIDGQEIEVPAGTTVLQAALSEGKEIPHYCYHPGLSVSGNCRMCLVEVEKAPKLMIGCATPVAEGMVVHTQSEKVKEAQAAVMEFLLINHPLDCPICDQAGECRLQEYAVEHGSGVSRFVETKLTSKKAVDIGKHITLDQERCIQCSRCIRFCDEVTGSGELAFFQRGGHTVIGTHPGKPLDNPYSGNVADICPVGALTTKEFRFQTRVWYLNNTPSVCAGCSRGCNVLIGVGRKQEMMTFGGQLDDSIKRIVPRVNEEVNGHWICDEGRLSYVPLTEAERLAGARASSDSELDWDDAVKRAAELLAATGGSGRAAAFVSPRLTSETMYAWKRIFDALGVKVAVQRLERGEDDKLLLRADRGANSRGAQWIFGADGDPAALAQSAGRGEIETLLVLGDPLNPADTLRLDETQVSRVKNVIYVGPFAGGAAEGMSLVLPAAAWSEEDGTLVNFEGRVQRVRRAHLPRGEGRPGWRVAADVGLAAGVELPPWGGAVEVLESMAADVPQLEGMNEERIGLLGAKGRVEAVAGS